MKAVIPAAGEGKRFNKDSTYMHKCLVPINGKALLLYTLENLTNIKEITECIVIIGENHEKIIDTIGTKVNDTPILFCKQKQSVKGVVGAIESAVEEIGNDDFILVLADEFVYENNYAEAIEKFKTSTNECMVGLYYEKYLEFLIWQLETILLIKILQTEFWLKLNEIVERIKGFDTHLQLNSNRHLWIRSEHFLNIITGTHYLQHYLVPG